MAYPALRDENALPFSAIVPHNANLAFSTYIQIIKGMKKHSVKVGLEIRGARQWPKSSQIFYVYLLQYFFQSYRAFKL
jgi:hypothetical protein